MSEPSANKTRREWFVSWVNGEREPKDQTLFVMEKRRAHRLIPSVEEREQRERHRLRDFLSSTPVAAVIICLTLAVVLLSAVLDMPTFGAAGNPINNEVAQHYLESTAAETGATNAVTGMILSYRGFDTLGESCVLFLAVSCVMLLLKRDGRSDEEHEFRILRQEDAIRSRYPDMILQQVAGLLVPFVFLMAIYVLLHGEVSPGGGFSGGTILGCGLILYSAAFGHERIQLFFNGKVYAAVRTAGLLLYALLYGYFIFMGANGMADRIPDIHGLITMPIDLAVGLVVACTVYGFYALFERGDV